MKIQNRRLYCMKLAKLDAYTRRFDQVWARTILVLHLHVVYLRHNIINIKKATIPYHITKVIKLKFQISTNQYDKHQT